MKPLIVLIVAFVVACAALLFIQGGVSLPLAGNIAMSVMLVFTAIGHFAYTKGMVMMIPPFVPFKTTMVYMTGAVEITAAIGLLIPSLQQTTAYWLVLFFILMLPCNIYAAVNRIDYQKGTTGGPGLKYLWFRVPMQVVLIVWVYLCNLS